MILTTINLRIHPHLPNRIHSVFPQLIEDPHKMLTVDVPCFVYKTFVSHEKKVSQISCQPNKLLTHFEKVVRVRQGMVHEDYANCQTARSVNREFGQCSLLIPRAYENIR